MWLVVAVLGSTAPFHAQGSASLSFRPNCAADSPSGVALKRGRVYVERVSCSVNTLERLPSSDSSLLIGSLHLECVSSFVTPPDAYNGLLGTTNGNNRDLKYAGI